MNRINNNIEYCIQIIINNINIINSCADYKCLRQCFKDIYIAHKHIANVANKVIDYNIDKAYDNISNEFDADNC